MRRVPVATTFLLVLLFAGCTTAPVDDGLTEHGTTPPPMTSEPTEPADGPDKKHPFAAERDRYHLKADDLSIRFQDGRLFAPARADNGTLHVDGDPGRPPGGHGQNGYHSIEITWMENGTEQRIFIYLWSDGQEWWSDEVRIYDGFEDGEWQYIFGDFFRTETGGTFTAERLELETDWTERPDGEWAPPGDLLFEGLALTAFIWE